MNNNTILIPIKKLHDLADLPTYGSDNAAGFDLTIILGAMLHPGETVVLPTGLSFEIPEGYEIQVRPRSGVSTKTPFRVILGTIDSDYRGPVGIIVQNTSSNIEIIEPFTKLAQGVLNKIPKAEFLLVSELGKTSRGGKGFGSTDK